MSIGGRFHSVRALILGNLRKSGKTRAFGERLDDDPVTKVTLFLWQILQGNTACAAKLGLSEIPFTEEGSARRGSVCQYPFFEILFCQVCIAINLEIQGTGLWKGHHNWAVDGSLFCISLF